MRCNAAVGRWYEPEGWPRSFVSAQGAAGLKRPKTAPESKQKDLAGAEHATKRPHLEEKELESK